MPSTRKFKKGDEAVLAFIILCCDDSDEEMHMKLIVVEAEKNV